MELIRIEKLCYKFQDGVYGLKNINLSIQKNEFVLIAGRNGSGKTLLMRHLNGLLKPSSGNVLFNNKNIKYDIKNVRKKIGLVFQDSDSQIIGETVFEDAAFGLKNLKMKPSDIKDRVDKILKKNNLYEKKDFLPYCLSGGEKRRLIISDIIAMEPECIILDEPFANLDYPSISNIIKILKDLKKNNITIIMLTHEIEKILSLTDRVIIMDKGEIRIDCKTSCIKDVCLEEFGLKNPFVCYEKIEDLIWE